MFHHVAHAYVSSTEMGRRGGKMVWMAWRWPGKGWGQGGMEINAVGADRVPYVLFLMLMAGPLQQATVSSGRRG